MAQGLIMEGYAMKGFRIDTKSCNWGPMAGFVCVDPRLTKDSVYEERNANWTSEALHGHIVEKFFGQVDDPSWVADVMPIVISSTRIEYLRREGLIEPRKDGNDWVGETKAKKGDVVLYWRLVPVGNATHSWLLDAGPDRSGYFVLCVNTRGAKPFKQQYVGDAKPVLFRGSETVLGLINPGSKKRGFKACVTADYDLFATWPKAGKSEQMGLRHALSSAILAHSNAAARPLLATVPRMPHVDDRLQSRGERESHRFGDVSARVLLIKTMLNTALIGAAGYQGGNAIHHNDEAGNFALAKGNLIDCLPLIGFYGGFGTVLISSLADFKELVIKARLGGFSERAKPQWLTEAGVGPAP